MIDFSEQYEKQVVFTICFPLTLRTKTHYLGTTDIYKVFCEVYYKCDICYVQEKEKHSFTYLSFHFFKRDKFMVGKKTMYVYKLQKCSWR